MSELTLTLEKTNQVEYNFGVVDSLIRILQIDTSARYK